MLSDPNGAAAGPRTPHGTCYGRNQPVCVDAVLTPELALSGRSAAFAGMSVQLGRTAAAERATNPVLRARLADVLAT